jgi:hypothetical protein
MKRILLVLAIGSLQLAAAENSIELDLREPRLTSRWAMFCTLSMALSS